MPRITFIGAGSLVFTRNLCSDILLAPALTDSTIALMDIDPVRLEQARSIVQAIADRRKLKAQVLATTDRREAVSGADYVITTFQQGGLDAYKLDIEIPRNMAWNSAWVTRWGRAASSGRCAPSRCSWTSAATWTSWRPTRCCSTT